MNPSITLSLLNIALGLDANAQQSLKKLVAKTLEVNITTKNFKKSFLIVFENNGIQWANPLSEPAVIISGPIFAFLKLAFRKDVHAATRGGLTFSGDNSILETLQDLFLGLEIDWEEYLSQWMGDIMSHQIGKWTRNAKQKNQEVAKSTYQNISEYLTEEARHFPTRLETDDFMNAIDFLYKDVERLSLRIERLSLIKNKSGVL